MIPTDGHDSSILMSDGLREELALDDEEASQLAISRVKIIVLKTKVNGGNDVTMCAPRGIGYDCESKTLSIEAMLLESTAIEVLIGIKSGTLTLHGVDLHSGEVVTSLLSESEAPYDISKCNVYDISADSDESTLVLSVLAPLANVQPI